jgi:3-deoxy-manno-octulosonate cytidylyltransferase (CMP-KDO synthetase)
VGFLQAFPNFSPAPTEQAESLEQLRALWHGHHIVVHVSDHVSASGVDTPEDLTRIRSLLESKMQK